MQMNQ